MSQSTSDLLGAAALQGRRPFAREAFHWALLVVTIAPYAVLGFQFAGVSGAGIAAAIIAFIATGHVPATFYLLTDGHIRRYVVQHRMVMIYLCTAVLIVNFLVFGLLAANVGGSSPAIVYCFMLFYIIWQTWHFGKQNLGVFAFSCICAQRGPILPIERRAIIAGSLAGLIGVYQAAGTGLKVYYSGPGVEAVDAVFSMLWYLGLAVLAVAFAMSLYAIWLRRKEATALNASLLVVSTIFFFPYFFVGDALLAFVSFTWAHGLQYILFLLAHAMSRKDFAKPAPPPSPRWIAYIALASLFFLFCGLFVRDLIVWSTQFATATAALLSLQANYPLVLNLVVAFLTGMTMVHFIWDARIWRLRDPEPRKWMRERFDFLFRR